MTNRYFRNKKQNGHLIFEVNKGGVITEAMRIDGSSGQANISGGISGPGSVPVGSIVQSILTLAQFQTQAGVGWVLMDGGSIVGSALATITGLTNTPDASGRFLRTAGGNADPALGNPQPMSTSATGLGGTAVALGTTNKPLGIDASAAAGDQARHAHAILDNNSTLYGAVGNVMPGSGSLPGITSPGSVPLTATASFIGSTDPGQHSHAVSGTTDINHSHSLSITGSTETRPVNLTVNTFIRIN